LHPASPTSLYSKGGGMLKINKLPTGVIKKLIRDTNKFVDLKEVAIFLYNNGPQSYGEILEFFDSTEGKSVSYSDLNNLSIPDSDNTIRPLLKRRNIEDQRIQLKYALSEFGRELIRDNLYQDRILLYRHCMLEATKRLNKLRP